jgi:hypothetical protein
MHVQSLALQGLKGLSGKEMFDDMLTTLAANVVPVSRQKLGYSVNMK